MLAGKGKLSARYQKHGEDFDAKASAELRELRLDGLPMAGRIDRDLVNLVASASGSATQSGWPRDWRNFSLEASSGQTECKVLAARNAATGGVTLNARARAEFSFKERHDLFEGELSASLAKGAWSAERISLALTPKPAGKSPARRATGPCAGTAAAALTRRPTS